MISPGLQSWLSTTPLALIAFIVLASMFASATLGGLARRWLPSRARPEGEEPTEGQHGYIVSAVLGLLALLLGFTFSLAVERFDARRLLVLDEANAIGTTYLRTQLLPEPHRARLSGLLVRYTDNRIALAKAKGDAIGPLLRTNDALITDIWAATAAGFDSVRDQDFSSEYLESVNLLIDLDASRKTARLARVPPAVFLVLFIYTVTVAGVLGYVLRGREGAVALSFLFGLLTLSLLLIIDVDRPNEGGVTEGQAPMEQLRATLKTWPPHVFDRWRTPPGRISPP